MPLEINLLAVHTNGSIGFGAEWRGVGVRGAAFLGLKASTLFCKTTYASRH